MLLNWDKEKRRKEFSIDRERNIIQVFIMSDVRLEVFFFFKLPSFVLTVYVKGCKM